MTKKTFMMFALLCLTLWGLGGMGAWAQMEVGTEEALRAVINENGSNKSVKMTADIQLGSRLVIENGKNVTLDLNGHTLKRTMEAAADDGNVIYVSEGGTLTISDGGGSGQITGGWAKEGGAIYNAGTLNIQGGAITYNKASSQGGGIWSKGTLTLSGGTVSHNEAPSTGGIDNTGTMTMTGGTVDFNVSTTWGGGGIANHHTLTISGGTISNNRADNAEGGGLWNEGTLEMKGGKVTGNHTKTDGGGIWNTGRLKMEGSIYVLHNFKNPAIENNVFLDGESVIDVSGALVKETNEACIGVGIPQSHRFITKGYRANNPAADANTFFRNDKDGYFPVLDDDDDELQLVNDMAPATFTEYSWDDANMKLIQKRKTKHTIAIGGDDDEWVTLGEKGKTTWYRTYGYTVRHKVFNILGEVHLVLIGNPRVELNHIKLEAKNDAKLHIHNEWGDDKGIVDVRNYYVEYSSTVSGGVNVVTYYRHYLNAAAIGGGEGENMGSLFIHGGNVSAIIQDDSPAAIGGGKNGSIAPDHKIVVYAGVLKAETDNPESNDNVSNNETPLGAAIGGSDNNPQGGPVIVYGGSVFATSNSKGAAIGGGEDSYGGTVKIYGGFVSAKCAAKRKGGSGIGGGYEGSGGDVHIFGGTVEVVGGGKNSAIGGTEGHGKGTIEFAPNMKVTAGDYSYTNNSNIPERVFTTAEREDACKYRHWAKIECCEHTTPTEGSDHAEAVTYTIDGDTHTKHCRYCAYTAQENHTFVENICTYCGKEDGTSDDLWSVTMFRATAAGTTSYAYRDVMKVVKGQPFTIPAVSATNGLTLMGYTTSWNDGDGIEMKDGETLTTAGAVVTPTSDMNYYSRYRYRYVPTWTWDEATATATLTITCSALSDEATNVTNITYTTEGEVKTATATYDHNGATYTFTDTYTLPLENLELRDNASNEETLENYGGRKVNTLTLSGRTLYKDGGWNTICLPFNLSEEQLASDACPLKDATIKTLDSSSFADGTLTLNFKDASSIVAGMPYIVKWESGDNITAPVFTDVIISATETKAIETTSTYFVGSFSPVSLTGGDKSVLYLGAGNKLYYPSADMTVGSFRAVFKLNGITAGDITSGAIELNFGEDEATGVREVKEVREVKDNSWYTLDGRRLSGKPTQKGIYINHGNKVVIK